MVIVIMIGMVSAGCCEDAQASLFSCLSALRYPLMVETWSHDCFHYSFFLDGLCFVPVASSSQFMMGALIHW
jgi:hypothetical protein